jgi:hypothetical protein
VPPPGRTVVSGGMLAWRSTGELGAAVDSDSHGAAAEADCSGAVEEARLEDVGDGGGVAGADAGAERAASRAWARTQSMMSRSTLRLDGEGQGVGAEGSDDLGQPLLCRPATGRADRQCSERDSAIWQCLLPAAGGQIICSACKDHSQLSLRIETDRALLVPVSLDSAITRRNDGAGDRIRQEGDLAGIELRDVKATSSRGTSKVAR